MKNIHPIFLTVLIGIVAGLLFIIFQPAFGMSTLTSRHAALYVNMGQYSATSALALAWLIHLLVSVVYALSVWLVFRFNRKLYFVSLSVLVLGWLTTVIAPVANFLVINFVNKFTLVGMEQWPAFNYSLDAKLALHLLFFMFIATALHFTLKKK